MRGFIQAIGLEGTDNASKKHSKVGVSGCIPLQEMLLSQSVLVQFPPRSRVIIARGSKVITRNNYSRA